MHLQINYFDLGLHLGDEIQMFLDAVESLDAKVNVYGFEAHPDLANKVRNRYKNLSNVNIYNKAISNKTDSDGMIKLFIANANRMEGNSIYATKHNVEPNNFVKSEAIKLSEWIKENLKDYKNSINVLRYNIEGAEVDLFQDLISSEMYEHIHLFLGSRGGEDILKCSEISHLHQGFLDTLRIYSINVHQFCSASINNIDAEQIRRKILSVNAIL